MHSLFFISFFFFLPSTVAGAQDEGGVQMPRGVRVLRAQDLLATGGQLQRGEHRRVRVRRRRLLLPQSHVIGLARQLRHMFFSCLKMFFGGILKAKR